MAIELPILTDEPSHRFRATLDGRKFVLRLTYRDRTASWYLDLYDVDEVPIALGRRLSPGSSPLLGVGVDRGPAGMLYVVGTEPYPRDGLRLIYIEAAELTASATPSTLAVTVDP